MHRSLHPDVRITGGVEATSNVHNAARLEESAGHVVGARPHQLHRLADGPGEFHGFRYVVDKETASEAAAEQGSVHLDRILPDAKQLGSFLLRGKRSLRGHPDLARVATHVRNAVHGFQRRVRLERIFVDCIDFPRSEWQSRYGIAISADEKAWF